MNKITIIIPYYNQPSLFDECLNSLITAKSFEKVDLLLVNDHGDFQCDEIAKKYAEKFTNISIFDNVTNQGVSQSRKNGAEFVETKWVAFVDGDDKVTPDYVEKILSYSEDEKFDSHSFNSQGFSMEKLYWFSRPRHHLEDHLAAQAMWSRLWKREIFLRMKFSNISYGEDLLSLLSLKENKLAKHPDFIYLYRSNSSSVTKNITEENAKDFLNRLPQKIELYKDNNDIFQVSRVIDFLKSKKDTRDAAMEYEEKVFDNNKILNITNHNMVSSVGIFKKTEYASAVWKDLEGNKLNCNIDLDELCSEFDVLMFNFTSPLGQLNVEVLSCNWWIKFSRQSIFVNEQLKMKFENSSEKLIDEFLKKEIAENNLKFAHINLPIKVDANSPVTVLFPQGNNFLISDQEDNTINYDVLILPPYAERKNITKNEINFSTFIDSFRYLPPKTNVYSRDLHILDVAQLKNSYLNRYYITENGSKKLPNVNTSLSRRILRRAKGIIRR